MAEQSGGVLYYDRSPRPITRLRVALHLFQQRISVRWTLLGKSRTYYSGYRGTAVALYAIDPHPPMPAKPAAQEPFYLSEPRDHDDNSSPNRPSTNL
jgi:hypothetical protein